MSDRLGTAQWEDPDVVERLYPFAEGKFWLGRAEDSAPIGYRDDRHICLVSGNRGGKGTSSIVNNLCFWPGSAVVIDPKGENATVTAARRGQGSEHCEGMGQAVHVLDPFNTAIVDDCYRSSFNPLADLDAHSDETIEEASRIANAIVVVRDDSPEPMWDESARTMVRGLILHVLTATEFTDEERNLITVRKLIREGEWRVAAALREMGHGDSMDPPHMLLWKAMEVNPAFDGIVAGIGSEFRYMMKSADKTYLGVFRAASQQTEFLDFPGMRRVLATSKDGFKLSELKKRPEGMTVYLCLPPRAIADTHFRWLRMMINLTITEMEITRVKPPHPKAAAPTATGHPLLMVLDEFAGLQRMSVIEKGVAQLAGFGVKLFFVLQTLEQLKATYKDNWETFLANAGLKLFFSIEDNFTLAYVSKHLGETEITRELKNFNESKSENESEAVGTSQSQTLSKSSMRGTSQSTTDGTSVSQTSGTSRSASRSRTDGVSFSQNEGENYSKTEGVSQSNSSTKSLGTTESRGSSSGFSSGTSTTFGPNGFSSTTSYGVNGSSSRSRGTSYTSSDGTTQGTSQSASRGASHGTSKGTSVSFTDGITDGTSYSDTLGRSESRTRGTSTSDTLGASETSGSSKTHTTGTSRTAGEGRNETIHRRPLIQPDEVRRHFARIDDRNHPRYPGVALVVVTGANPLIVRRIQYFEDPLFIDCFSPHPDHEFTRAISYSLSGKLLREALEDAEVPRLAIKKWLLAPGQLAIPGQVVATIEGLPPDNRTARIFSPCFGKVTATARLSQHRLPDGQYAIPDGDLITVKYYPGWNQDFGIDPFAEIRAPRRKPIQAPPQPAPAPEPESEGYSGRSSGDSARSWLGGLVAVGFAGVALYFYLFQFSGAQFVQDHPVRFIIGAVIVGCLLWCLRASS